MTLLAQEHREWPASEEEAVARANLYKDHDPYPKKKAALLGSDDFLDYARVTGMIYPCDAFDKPNKVADPERIKPASYEVRPGEKFFRYDNDGNLIAIDLSEDKDCYIHLPPNSITFVSTNETIRLPNYIAMRFNLRIQHVHRGILLGTGPMVDPGYGRRILIPLHNLTDDDYYIPTTRGLIWVEFTKTSWTKPGSTPTNQHNVYLPSTTEKELREFLIHANQGRPIRSSIPRAVVEATAAASAADHRAKQLEQQIRAFGIIGLIALILTLAGVMIPILSLVQDTGSLLEQTRRDNEPLKTELRRLDSEVKALRDARERQRRPSATGSPTTEQ
jgi:deoxycytidine triphosphate deaminase